MRTWLLGVLVFGLAACGSNGPSGFDTDGGATDGSVGNDDAPSFTGDGATGDGGACVNLQCKQVDCGGGATTTVSGTVVTATPSQYGSPDPIYNAIVYVPNAAVDPFPAGVSCDQCGAAVSGSPVVVALSDSSGKFTLKNVPVGDNIPLVVQIGRWRRQVVIPTVKQCVDNPIPTTLTHIPRNKSEGDIPHIAIATSTYDAEECILLKMGVDVSEFTASSGNGRIHLYHGNGTTLPGASPMADLTASLATLKQYDVVQFPCSSVPVIGGSPGQAGKNLLDYLDAGGRAFATDLSYSWYKDGPAPLPSTAPWGTWGGGMPWPLPATIDQSFPKGKALAEWLKNIGATPTQGSIDLNETYHITDSVNAPTSRWLYSTSPTSVQTLSFNTPIGNAPDKQCGRAYYSNFHIAGGQSGGGTTFPAECDSKPLTPQEKAMEFFLFDLSSCVQDDSKPPVPPK